MLTHLYIQHYALIEQLDIDFRSGLSVITGETGAGKSIILGALALVMGGRADTKTISEGETRCIIEATFTDTLSGEELLIRRELNSNGRSRSFVNDEVVSQQELKQLASQLIDIHSQHENLLLGDDMFQLGIVDSIAFGKDRTLLNQYDEQYTLYTDLVTRLHTLEQEAKQARKDADYIRFQWQQLDEANLQEDELNDLEQEAYQLSHAEEIQTTLQNAINILTDDNQGVLSLLHSVKIDNVSQELAERLDSAKIELEDIAEEAGHISQRIEADPQRLQAVEERISLIQSLLRKHSLQTIDELIELRNRLEQQCLHIDSYDEDIATLQQQVNDRREELRQKANLLTEQRLGVRSVIIDTLTGDLQQLGIRHPHIDIAITPTEDFTPYGCDDVQVMFAANLNQSLRRVSEVASGGEISRLMLCIKALIASTNGLPTIIFDEIDTGVSGEIASRMGMIMRKIAQTRQVIAITHLPQIAALGERQYKVFKQDNQLRTETRITLLNDEERINEIASMLSGNPPSPAAISNAKELLKN